MICLQHRRSLYLDFQGFLSGNETLTINAQLRFPMTKVSKNRNIVLSGLKGRYI